MKLWTPQHAQEARQADAPVVGKQSLEAVTAMRVGGAVALEVDIPSEALLEAPIQKSSHSRQVDTPEFRGWFGGSKVVDKVGDPLLLVHGTPHDFKAFRPSDVYGIWFGSRDSCDVDLAILDEGTDKRIPRIPSPDPDVFPEFPVGARTIPVYLKIKNPCRLDGNYPNLKDMAIQGHDGAIDYDPVTGEIVCAVVLDPSQIKSAIGNCGAFSPIEPDITR